MKELRQGIARISNELDRTQERRKRSFKILTLPLPRGCRAGPPPPKKKGFSSITFEQNNLETSNFA